MTATLENMTYSFLRQQLMEGALVPGQKINEAEIASLIGVSRTPVREAILRLRTEGLIEQVPGRGTFVREPDARELIELYELRRLIELHAVDRAARRISPGDLEQLEAYCREMRLIAAEQRRRQRDAAGKDEGGGVLPRRLIARAALADVRFHLLVLRAAGNRRSAEIVSDLHLIHLRTDLDLYRRGGRGRQSPLSLMARLYLEHWRVLRALQRQDRAAARYWMGRHLLPVARVSEAIRALVERRKQGARFGLETYPASARRLIRQAERDAIRLPRGRVREDGPPGMTHGAGVGVGLMGVAGVHPHRMRQQPV